MAYNNENAKRVSRADGNYSSKNAVKTFTIIADDQLLNFLFAKLNDKSKTSVKSLLSHQQIAINNVPTTKFDAVLKPGDQVSINFEKAFNVFRHPQLSILYEDDSIIVVDKSAGLLSISTDRIKDKTAYRILSDYIKLEDPHNKLFVLHRLDRDTSGLMMFAKGGDIKSQLQGDWENAIQQRCYTAVIEGEPEQESGEISSYLTENSAFKVYSTSCSIGKYALTRYRTIQTNGMYSLIELELETGRKNQIRVHMEQIGHPIVGDKKYGATSSPIGRMCLHASKLSFIHPVSQKLMQFETKIPMKFRQLLRHTKL